MASTLSDTTLNLNGIEIVSDSTTVTVGGLLSATKVYNAVWHDIADSVTIHQESLEPGYAYAFDGEKWFKTESQDSPYFGIHSDTAGYTLGYDPESNQINLAIGGFVLAYVDMEYPSGTKLTYSSNGTLTKASEGDEIVAKFFRTEPETLYNNIEVKGRHWVKVL